MKNHFNVKDGRNSQAEGSSGHKISNNALMRFSLVYLPELLLAVELNANTVLENVLDVLLLGDNRAVLILSLDNFLEIGWVAPGNLDCGRSLCNMRKDAHGERVFLNLKHVSFQQGLVKLKAILKLVHRYVRWRHRQPPSFLSEVVRHCPLSVAS